MPLRRPRRAPAWLAPLAAVASAAALAAPAAPADSNFGLDVGLGMESQTSPLVQITPQSDILYLPGLQRLRGTHVRTAVQGFTHVDLGAGKSLSLSGDASLKRAPGSPDLDFFMGSVQPMLHLPLGAGSLGLGLNLLRLDVARQPFRQARSLQATWALPDGPHLWSVVAETGVYRHKGLLADLDAQSSSAVLQRQIRQPLKGIELLDLSLILGRERNQRGFAELSHRSAMLNAAITWNWLGASWTAGTGWRQPRYDDTAFPNEPLRRDRARNLDVAAQWPLNASQALRVEYGEVRNTSNTRLYDNRYQQLSVVLRTSW